MGNRMEDMGPGALWHMALQAKENQEKDREVEILRALIDRHGLSVESVAAERRLKEMGEAVRRSSSEVASIASGNADLLGSKAQPSFRNGVSNRKEARIRQKFSMPSDEFQTSIAVSSVIKILGWLIILVGIFVFFAMIGKSIPQLSQYSSVGFVPSVLGALFYSVPIALSGLVLVLVAEVSLALFDIANTNRKALAVALFRLENE